jgi:hypothetical protein
VYIVAGSRIPIEMSCLLSHLKRLETIFFQACFEKKSLAMHHSDLVSRMITGRVPIYFKVRKYNFQSALKISRKFISKTLSKFLNRRSVNYFGQDLPERAPAFQHSHLNVKVWHIFCNVTK